MLAQSLPEENFGDLITADHTILSEESESFFCERLIATTSIWSKSLAWFFPGAMVEYHPICAKDFSILHQFDSKVLPGTFFGYVLYVVRISKGDTAVADIEEMEEMVGSEFHARRR